MPPILTGRGRLDRLGYLIWVLAAGVLLLAPATLLVAGGGAVRGAVLAIGAVVWVAVAWLYGTATVRRLHDANLTGWLALLALIPVVGLAALTVALLILPGTPGPNRYGQTWL